MSIPCGYKKNTETVAQYRKRCGGRPLGMIMKNVGESKDEIKVLQNFLTKHTKSAKKASSMIKKYYKKVKKQFKGDSTRDVAMAIVGYDALGENKDLFKMYTQAMKMLPGSPKQKELIKKISSLRKKLKMDEAPRKPRKKGQHRNSPNHSDLYTDENPKGTIKGLKFATVQDAEKSVSKIKNSGKSHAHKIQAAVAMEQRAREMGKSSQAAVYRRYINKMKKKTKKKNEGWSDKYKKSIDCNNPKGFSQKAHCAGRKKRESVMEHTCHDCGQPIDINEAGFKFVIRNKKKVKKLICPPGTKAKGRKKCVRMTGAERVRRAKGLKVTRRKAKAKIAKTLRKRAKSMKKRQSMIGESLKLEELVGKPITEAQFDEAAGKKDACYHKVKARYDVWPSAYASGALVKCRKVGAKNWGNKSKKENVSESYDIWMEDGSWGYTLDGIVEAEYQGRKVKLGKPMQGDSKKFKVYVKNDKGNVVKVNFGHGGSSAKGKTMRIRKSNPKARANFRARHNCDNPGPRWKARYWSCKKW